MVLLVWGGGEGQMTSEFIHEEISIMDCNGLSGTIKEGGGEGSRPAWMTGIDDWHG